jgi:phage protein D
VAELPINQPQIRVAIGGVPVSGVISAEVERVAFFAADRFTVSFSVDASGLTFDFFSSAGKQVATIDVALEEFGYVQLLTGQIDNIYCDLLQNKVTISGRDLSAQLIDTEIAETFANQTSSQIATRICERHNLTPNVTATSTLVGQYYELDHARSGLGLGSRSGTEWNLLAWLAQIEGFALSVFGTKLTFGVPPAGAPFRLSPQGCIDLSIDTAASLPGTTVVKSWSPRNKTVTTQTANRGLGTTATLIRPSLTSQQAALLARNHLSTLQTHGTVLLATLPGETSLSPGGTITLFGTDSSFDQNYAIDVIRRSVDAKCGYVQQIRAHALN